jgi:hypothetical protein
MIRSLALFILAGAAGLMSGQAPSTTTPGQAPGGLKAREDAADVQGTYRVEAGTHILLSMINSVSTKQAHPGDRIYLETAFPILSQGRIIIPQGSWVAGTVTEVKRPGHVKGRGEMQVRFDSLTLPNGTSRDFRADLGAIDARSDQTLKREESKVTGPGDKKGDVGTVVGSTVAGTVIGSGIGAAAGNTGRGAGIGTGAGAAAGLIGVLASRGPDATLSKGSTVEMVLDRPISFSESELNFSNAPPRGATSEESAPPAAQPRSWTSRIPH